MKHRCLAPHVLLAVAVALPVGAGPPPSTDDTPSETVSLPGGTLRLVDALEPILVAARINLVADPALDVYGLDVECPEIHAVPWPQALDALTKANGLEAEIRGSVIRISPQDGGCRGAGLRGDPDPSGRTFTLMGKDMDTTDLLRYFSEALGLGLVMDSSAQGAHHKTNLYLPVPIPLEQALDLVLRDACLEGEIDAGALHVVGAHLDDQSPPGGAR